MAFRPLPILTLLTLPLLAVLIWLGSWQIQRADWKANLITNYAELETKEPISLAAALCEQRFDVPIATRDMVSSLSSDRQTKNQSPRMFGRSAEGQPGWVHLNVTVTTGCDDRDIWVLTETGFSGIDLTLKGTEQQYTGTERFVLRQWPARPSFTSQNDPTTNAWYWFDHEAMTEALQRAQEPNLHILSTGYIAISEGLPGYLTRTPPSRHIGYAVTWFGMALGLLIIYAVFHMKAGRLSLSQKGHDQE